MTMKAIRRLSARTLLVAALAWPTTAFANDPIAIAESFFDEIRKAGASAADHGPITYDPGDRTLIIPDIKVHWPISFSFGTAGGVTVDIEFIAPEVSVAGLRETEGGYRMDDFRYGDGTQMNAKATAGDSATVSMTFHGAVYKDIFWPFLPTIQSDPNLPASRYFPYLRWATNFETGRFEMDRMVYSQAGGADGALQETVYEGLTANGYRDGKIGEYRIRRMISETKVADFDTTKPAEGETEAKPNIISIMKIETGEVLYRGYDIGAVVRMIDPESYLLGNTDPKFHTILEEGSASDVKVTSDVGFEFGVRRYYGRGMKMRQPKQSIFAMADRAIRGEEPSEQELVAFMLSIFQSFAVDELAIDDINLVASDDTKGSLERAAIRDLSPDGLGEFIFERFGIASPQEGNVNLERFRLTGLTFPTAEAIIALTRHQGPGDPPVRVILDVMPMLSLIEISGFTASIPVGSVSLDRFTSEMGGHIPPFPTRLRERVENLVLPAVVFQDEPELRDFLRALGLTEVRFNSEIDIRWDEATKDLIVETVAVDVDGAARASFEARVAGVPRLVFENPEAAQAALGTLAFTSMRFELHNEKLVQTAINTFAKETGMPPDQAVNVLLAQMREGLGAINSPAFAEQVDAAMTEFLANPRSLTITATPNQPMPATQILGMVAVAPQAIIDQLNVKIEAR